jgi:hypothetical protein
MIFLYWSFFFNLKNKLINFKEYIDFFLLNRYEKQKKVS